MRKKLLKIFPTVLSLLIATTVLVVGWVANDTIMNGITISSSGSGVQILIKGSESEDFSDTMNVGLNNVELQPSEFKNGKFYDQFGVEVTSDPNYVRSQYIIFQAEKSCRLSASKSVNGSLPVGVVFESTEIGTNTDLVSAGKNPKGATIYFYVDGNKYTEPGTATVNVVLHGE